MVLFSSFISVYREARCILLVCLQQLYLLFVIFFDQLPSQTLCAWPHRLYSFFFFGLQTVKLVLDYCIIIYFLLNSKIFFLTFTADYLQSACAHAPVIKDKQICECADQAASQVCAVVLQGPIIFESPVWFPLITSQLLCKECWVCLLLSGHRVFSFFHFHFMATSIFLQTGDQFPCPKSQMLICLQCPKKISSRRRTYDAYNFVPPLWRWE